MNLLIKREIYTTDATAGQLYIDSDDGTLTPAQHVCYTLEDARRLPGVKIPGDTCIPAGRYRASVSRSNRFNRNMPIIYNVDNGYELRAEGVTFTGVRMHGGNTHVNTHGCPLVAYNRIDDETIQGTAETEVTALIETALDAGEEVWLEVRD